MKKVANKSIWMTGNDFLLDTNIVSGWLKGEVSIAKNIAGANNVYIPVIVIGELYYGALYATQTRKNISDIQRISLICNVLAIDESTAFHYGEIKCALRKIGKPIPENDIWIAAIALQHSLTIVTRDKHFNEIQAISIKRW